MPSSAEQIKLSKATTRPPTCPDNRPLDLLKEVNIALHSLKLQIGGLLVLLGSTRALIQHKRLSVSSQPQICQCSICKNGQKDARCKPLHELLLMMTTALNQHLRIPVICALQLSLGRFFPTPSLRIKIADTQGEWSCVALYLEIGQDNGCCHRSWQATRCNFCRILHSGSTLQSRSSAAAPSSQSHPFANFFSEKPDGQAAGWQTAQHAQASQFSPEGCSLEKGRHSRVKVKDKAPQSAANMLVFFYLLRFLSGQHI